MASAGFVVVVSIVLGLVLVYSLVSPFVVLLTGVRLFIAVRCTSAKPVIAPEGSYIPEPPEALEQLTFLRSPLEG